MRRRLFTLAAGAVQAAVTTRPSVQVTGLQFFGFMCVPAGMFLLFAVFLWAVGRNHELDGRRDLAVPFYLKSAFAALVAVGAFIFGAIAAITDWAGG